MKVRTESETLFEYAYNPSNLTQEVTHRYLRQNSAGRVYEKSSVLQNTAGQMLETKDAAGLTLSKNVYREDGNLIASYQRDVGSFVLAKAFEYDTASGQPHREITFVGGGPAFGSEIEYDTNDDDVQMVVRRFDSDGNLIEIADAGGNLARNYYDLLGRVTAQVSPDSVQGVGANEVQQTTRTTTFQYKSHKPGGIPEIITTTTDPNNEAIRITNRPTHQESVEEWIKKDNSIERVIKNHASR